MLRGEQELSEFLAELLFQYSLSSDPPHKKLEHGKGTESSPLGKCHESTEKQQTTFAQQECRNIFLNKWITSQTRTERSRARGLSTLGVSIKSETQCDASPPRGDDSFSCVLEQEHTSENSCIIVSMVVLNQLGEVVAWKAISFCVFLYGTCCSRKTNRTEQIIVSFFRKLHGTTAQ